MKKIRAFTLDEDVVEELGECAYKHRTSQSAMVNDAIKYYIEYMKDKYERFEREEK